MTDPAPGGQISVDVGSSALSCHKKIEFPPGESFWKAVGKLFLIEKRCQYMVHNTPKKYMLPLLT